MEGVDVAVDGHVVYNFPTDPKPRVITRITRNLPKTGRYIKLTATVLPGLSVCEVQVWGESHVAQHLSSSALSFFLWSASDAIPLVCSLGSAWAGTPEQLHKDCCLFVVILRCPGRGSDNQIKLNLCWSFIYMRIKTTFDTSVRSFKKYT